MTYTEAQLEETRNTIAAIHTTICPRNDTHDWKECQTARWLYNGHTIDAIAHLKAAPRDAAGARLILHDAVCASGCTGASATEHAKRQTKTVAALRKYLAGAL